MRDLFVPQKTGFRVLDPSKPIIIRDQRGIVFYTTEPMLPRVTWFNLPAGRYKVDQGGIVSTQYPRKYKMITLPPKQRTMKDPTRFKVQFAENPNKCTVSWSMETITFDDSFRSEPLPVLDFILFHEFGHQFYGAAMDATQEQKEFSEKCCDMFAANRMKQKGYNPSQIGRALITSLSSRQIERKENIVTELKKTL